jgi:hypothetical protein
MAERRTEPMIAWYGHYVREISLQTLVASAYLQGVEDCFGYREKATANSKPSLFENPHGMPLALECGPLGSAGI